MRRARACAAGTPARVRAHTDHCHRRRPPDDPVRRHYVALPSTANSALSTHGLSGADGPRTHMQLSDLLLSVSRHGQVSNAAGRSHGVQVPLGHQPFAHAALTPVPRLTPLRWACRLRVADSRLAAWGGDAHIVQFECKHVAKLADIGGRAGPVLVSGRAASGYRQLGLLAGHPSARGPPDRARQACQASIGRYLLEGFVWPALLDELPEWCRSRRGPVGATARRLRHANLRYSVVMVL
jgi:hypothetical protein